MSTPAQRYAASRRRARESRSRGGASTEGQPSPEALAAVDAFAAELAFPLDDFQREACEAVAAGRGVLVAAPTGAGKTVVGEFAVHQALATGRKAFYTTPIKALSNQKYHDLCERHGDDKVGLLTGDTSVNGEAPAWCPKSITPRAMEPAPTTATERSRNDPSASPANTMEAWLTEVLPREIAVSDRARLPASSACRKARFSVDPVVPATIARSQESRTWPSISCSPITADSSPAANENR